jgi:hypothetical protein
LKDGQAVFEMKGLYESIHLRISHELSPRTRARQKTHTITTWIPCIELVFR